MPAGCRHVRPPRLRRVAAASRATTEHALDAREHLAQIIGASRQQRDAEMVAVGHVEARARHHQHVLGFQQSPARTRGRRSRRAASPTTAGKRVQRALRRDQRRCSLAAQLSITARRVSYRRPPGAAQRARSCRRRAAPASIANWPGTFAHRRSAPSRSIAWWKSPLASGSPRQHRPAHAPAAGAMHLRQAAERQARQVAGERRERLERRVVVEDLVVDLVGTSAAGCAARRWRRCVSSSSRG